MDERSKHTQKSSAEYQETLEEVTERVTLLNEEKTELIGLLSQKNRSVQEVEAAMLACQQEQEKYQRSAKEIIEELQLFFQDNKSSIDFKDILLNIKKEKVLTKK